MLEKAITYTDYRGNSRTETFYFNLSKAEVAEMELGTTGGMEQKIRKMMSLQDQPEIMKLFKEIIISSYGEISADGRVFLKRDKDGYLLANTFVQTEAYSVLLMEIFQGGADAVATFINGILPQDLVKQMAETGDSGQIVEMPAK